MALSASDMQILGDLKDNLVSALGNPKKAFMVIHKQPAGSSDDSRGLTEQIENALAVSGSAGLSALAAGFANTAHIMQVQYNPSSISFQANAAPIPMQSLQNHVNPNIINQLHCPPAVIMSVQLIFDAVNNSDSFLMDRLIVRPGGNLTGNVMSAVAANIEPYTVQPQTNGLLALALFKRYRRVTFHWAETTFTGEIKEAQARYTMFSVSGRPVRSFVQLSIRQQVDGKGNHKYWNKAFDKCFGGEEEETQSGQMNIGQYVSSFMNLGI